MITKIDDYEIKHQPNTNIFFLDHDNPIKDETKPIMKLNTQLTQYLRMKKKLTKIKLNLLDPGAKSTNQTCK
jgi:hypothetical protein